MKNTVVVFFVLFILLILTSTVSAQTIDTLWTKIYWVNQFDSANCIQETSDKGFIIAGGTQIDNENQHDINLIKTDSLGEVEWTKQIGDSVSQCAYHVLQTYDGGYLVSAYSYTIHSTGGGIWIVRTDNVGDTLWTYTFLPEDRGGFPLYAIETLDSGYAITGLINLSGYFNDAFILKLDKDGDYVNYAHYGNSFNQDGRFITQMPDSGFIVAGWESNIYTTSDDFRAFRTDKYLNTIWDSTYVLTDYSDEIYGACKLEDGIVMVGQARGAGHAHKIDFDGNSIWSRSISQYATGERNTSVCPTIDSGMIVGGWVGVAGHRRDYSFIKLNHEGDVQSVYTVGGSQDDHAQFIVPTYDGNYIMAGLSYSFGNGACTYVAKVQEIYNTQVGNDVEVILDSGVTVQYNTINMEGETTIDVTLDGPALPGAYSTVPADPSTYYHLTTTATYDGNIEVCIEYDPLLISSEESELTLQHYNGLIWEDITSSIDTLNNIICGVTTSLSPFILAQPIPTGIIDNGEGHLPSGYSISQNYPNPFNPSTTFKFSLPKKSFVSIEVFNLLGKKVWTLVEKEMSAGEYEVEWNGMNDEDKRVTSGMYLFRFNSEKFSTTGKMILMK